MTIKQIKSIAKILGLHNASRQMIEAFVDFLKEQHYSFNEDRFYANIINKK